MLFGELQCILTDITTFPVSTSITTNLKYTMVSKLDLGPMQCVSASFTEKLHGHPMQYVSEHGESLKNHDFSMLLATWLMSGLECKSNTA